MDFSGFGDVLLENANGLLALSDISTLIIPIALFGAIVTGSMAAMSPRRTRADMVKYEMFATLDSTPLTERLETQQEKYSRSVEKLNPWSKYWYRSFQRAAIGQVTDVRQPGMIALAAMCAGVAIGKIAIGDIGFILGPIITLATLAGSKSFAATKKNEAFDRQLGLLVDAMKQNLQGGKTPPNALASAIEELPDPLYSEMYVVRNEILTGAPMHEILTELSERNDSREMKFLASALKISTKHGADLSSQLKVIQEKLDARARITRNIKEAVSRVKPTVFVVGLAVPGATLYAFLQPAGPEALFSFAGLTVLAVSYVLYAIGLWLIVRAVKKTSEF